MEKPHLILAAVWDILWDAIKNYKYNSNANQAAAISLYAILSFIPLFILTMIAANYIFGTRPFVQHELIETIQGFHPYFSESLLKQLGHIEQKKHVLGWVGILSLIWFSAMIFNAIEKAMNIIFRSRKYRNYFVSKLLAISMIPMGWTVGIASVGITYMSALIAEQPLLSGKQFVILPVLHGALFRYILPYLLIVAFFTIVYKVIPTVKVTLVSAFTGAAIFSVLTEIAKHFFTWYVSKYARYHVIFGSLETVVILVIWVFYVALILLFCAELISSYQRRNLILLEKAFLKPGKKFMKIEERLFRKFGRMYPKGDYIFRQGDTGEEMYYILMGNVRVEKITGQVKKALAEMGPGQYFGEMAALIDAPRTASVQATEDSNVAVIDGNTFRNLLRESGEVSLYMLKEFSNRIKQTGTVLGELTQSWVSLISVLYFCYEWPLPDNKDPLDDLARYTRKDPFEIQQVLWDLRNQGVIDIKDGRVSDFNKERAWELLNEQVFFPDRRLVKRELEIHI
ncbi:MAG TPA: YhjD/YihY/BrkB family envelope integrity protein [Syntrophales bacterium]|nr:YhjD/YihY/BrkB family envelope integrity protein [Syntrophales bacterium]